MGSYAAAYKLDPTTTPLIGTYVRNYDSVAVAPWLWNAEKKVFLSTEDKQSIDVKADYVIDKEIGGIMFWELAVTIAVTTLMPTASAPQWTLLSKRVPPVKVSTTWAIP